MTSIAPADIHLRIVEAIRTLPGWRESSDPPTTFPRDPAASRPRDFALELSPPQPYGMQEGSRGRRPDGIGTWECGGSIKWLWALNAERGGDSYREMLEAEHQLLDAVSRCAGGPDSDPVLHVRIPGPGTRIPVGDGALVIGTIPVLVRFPFEFHPS